jgi:voltage-gated potassium channel
MFKLQIYEALRFKKTARYLRRFNFSLIAIILVLLFGVIGLMIIERYSVSEALYMVIITISTVGYGEVNELSNTGRVFVIILILLNMGVLAYSVSTVTSFILEGELRKHLKDYRVYQKVQNLSDHVIVCGFGRHGQEIVQELMKNKLKFVVIENNEQKVSEMRVQDDFLFIDGDATHDQILLEAGIIRAQSIIVTTGQDAENVFITLSARQLNPKLNIVSRAVDKITERKLIRAGASHVVVPERLGGFYMATLVHKPEVVEFFTLISNMGSANIQFEEIECDTIGTDFLGKSIKDVNIRGKTGVNIIGLREIDGSYIVNPSPDSILKSGMRLVILGNSEQVETFKNVMVKWREPK